MKKKIQLTGKENIILMQSLKYWEVLGKQFERTKQQYKDFN